MIVSCILLLAGTHSLCAQTLVPGIFSDNMVLQQQEQVLVWGNDLPRKAVKISGSWGQTVVAVTDSQGNWKTRLKTPSAGGPYMLTFAGTSEKVIKNVLIGEVWFCSGQSNMEMPVKGYGGQPVLGSNEAILNSANDRIRYRNPPRSVSIRPTR